MPSKICQYVRQRKVNIIGSHLYVEFKNIKHKETVEWWFSEVEEWEILAKGYQLPVIRWKSSGNLNAQHGVNN